MRRVRDVRVDQHGGPVSETRQKNRKPGDRLSTESLQGMFRTAGNSTFRHVPGTDGFSPVEFDVTGSDGCIA